MKGFNFGLGDIMDYLNKREAKFQADLEATVEHIKKSQDQLKELVVGTRTLMQMVKEIYEASGPMAMRDRRRMLKKLKNIRELIVSSVLQIGKLSRALAVLDVQNLSNTIIIQGTALNKALIAINEIYSNILELTDVAGGGFIFRKSLKYRLWNILKTFDDIELFIIELHKRLLSISTYLKNPAVVSFKELSDAIAGLTLLFDNLRVIRTHGVKAKIKLVIKAIEGIEDVIKKINDLSKFKDLEEAEKNIKTVQTMIKSFSSLLVSVMLLAPVALLFIIISPFIILMIGVVSMIVFLIMKFVSIAVSGNAPIQILWMVAIIGLIVLLAAGLLTLSMIAADVIKGIPAILLLVLGLIAFMAVFALFGFTATFLWPMMTVGVFAVALVTLAVGAILMIALMMKVLEILKINSQKIKRNVRTILNTASMIALWIFEPFEDIDEDDSVAKKNSDILNGAANFGLRLGGSLIGAVTLVLALISVIAILLLAVMLKIIENININHKKVNQTIRDILNTCDSIINIIFADDNAPKENSDRNGQELVKYSFPGALGKVFASLAAMSYLVLMVISLAAIVLIASLLRLIMEINIDSPKIRVKVGEILGIVKDIISSIIIEDNENSDSSDRNVMDSLLTYASSTLGPLLKSIFSMAYLAVMVIAVACILAIAGLLKAIEKIEFDKNKITDNIRDVLDTVRLIISSIFVPDTENKDSSDRGIMGTLIEYVFEPLAQVIQAIMAVAFLAVAIIAIVIILGIAKMLGQIAKIDRSIFSDARENVKSIMETMTFILDYVFGGKFEDGSEKPSSEEKGIFSSIIGWVAPGLSDLISGILFYKKVAQMSMAIYMLAGIAKSLKEVASIDNSSIATAKANALTIMDAAKEIYDLMMKGEPGIPEPKDKPLITKLISSFLKNKVENAEAMASLGKLSVTELALGIVTRMSEDINTLSKLTFNQDAANKAAADVMYSAKIIVESVIKDFKGLSAKDLKKIEPLLDAMSTITSHIVSLGESLDTLAIFDSTNIVTAETVGSKVIETIKKLLFNIVDDSGGVGSSNPRWSDISKNSSKFKSVLKVLKSNLIPFLGEMKKVANIIVNLAGDILKLNNTTKTEIEAAKAAGESTLKTSNQLLKNRDIIKDFEESEKAIQDQNKAYHAVLDSVSSLQARFKSMQLMSEKEVTTKADSIKRTLSEFKAIIGQTESLDIDIPVVQDNLDIIDRITSTTGSFVKVTDSDVRNAKKITEAYSEFLVTVDKMDANKLNSTQWMMKHWASISKDLRGDFNGMAKAINQNIMPMLDKLNKTMEEVTATQQSIIDELTEPIEIVSGNNENTRNTANQILQNMGASNTLTDAADNSTSPSMTIGPSSSKIVNQNTNQQSKPSSSMQAPYTYDPFNNNSIDSLKTGKKYYVEFADIKEA